ncbi:hypothetical protein [Ghiorsea bivora]|uniref:hypothetical protein n=1 Tax=Ghiorsea bivora TaxID=1485545 RepID=UPI000571EF9E|nr:hypothetical protein [Ghiorsea bivora]
MSHFQLGMDIGDAHARRKQRNYDNNEIDKANAVIERCAVRLEKSEPLAEDYKAWLESKKSDGPDQFFSKSTLKCVQTCAMPQRLALSKSGCLTYT